MWTRKLPTRLTDSMVKRLTSPASGNEITYDADVKGFGCRVTAAGARAFVLNYRRKADGRERRITIGSFPDWGTAAARDEARRLKRHVDGGDLSAISKRAAPSVADLCERFKASRMLRVERPDIAQRYWRQGVLWSPSYFAASTGGATLEMAKRYVESQRASSSP